MFIVNPNLSNDLNKAFDKEGWNLLSRTDFSDDMTYKGPKGDFGYPVNRVDVSPEYLIRVKSTAMDRRIYALLQDPFYTSVKSDWKSPAFGTIIKNLAQETIQATTGLAVGSQFMTRRVWYGSSPMYLQVKLKFEAIVDAYTEVVVPAGTLQQMALPSKLSDKTTQGKTNLVGYVLMVPPGPNPYNGAVREWVADKYGEWARTRPGDIITIDIGNFISFSSVIVRQADIVWGKRYTKEGYPTSATATIYFETFEMYTKEDAYNEFMAKRLEKVERSEDFQNIKDKWLDNNELDTGVNGVEQTAPNEDLAAVREQLLGLDEAGELAP